MNVFEAQMALEGTLAAEAGRIPPSEAARIRSLFATVTAAPKTSTRHRARLFIGNEHGVHDAEFDFRKSLKLISMAPSDAFNDDEQLMSVAATFAIDRFFSESDERAKMKQLQIATLFCSKVVDLRNSPSRNDPDARLSVMAYSMRVNSQEGKGVILTPIWRR